jgi:hypothetical protein
MVKGLTFAANMVIIILCNHEGSSIVAYIAKHFNKKTGATYVYLVESYWDKEKSSPETDRYVLAS